MSKLLSDKLSLLFKIQVLMLFSISLMYGCVLCTEHWGTHIGMSQSQRQARAKERKDLEVYMLPVACRVGQGGGVKRRDEN